MRVGRTLFLSVLAAVIFACLGCEKLNLNFFSQPGFKPEGTIVAQVDNMYITLEQLNQEIENLNALNSLYYNAEPKKFTTEEKLTFLKEEMVPRYLFYKEAKERGLDKQNKVQELLLNAQVRVLDEQFIKQQTADSSATSQEIESFYNNYKERFRQEEERRIREILADSESEAKDILIELLKGADFATLAQQRSKAESAAKGGDLGFIKKGQRGTDFKRFDDVAFSASLEAGQISPVFKDTKGYFIVRIEATRGGQTTPLNEVWEQVKNAVVYLKQQQKMQELKDGLAKKAKIQLFQEQVK
jgi:peptidyl-prolyl cis-trans isomerase C